MADTSEDRLDAAKGIEVIFEKNYPVISGLHTIHLREKNNHTIPNYKTYFVASKSFRYFTRKYCEGIKVFSIKPSLLKYTNFSFPANYKEQEKIVVFLTLIDKKINLVNRKIETLKKYKEGLLNLLIKSADEFVALKQLATLYQPKNLSKDKFNINGKYYVYGANGIIGKSDFYNHEKEEIVIGCRGNCNAVILTNKKSWINSNAMVVLPNDKIKKMELYYMMQTISFRKYIEGSGVPQITREKAKLIQVPFLKHNEQIFTCTCKYRRNHLES